MNAEPDKCAKLLWVDKSDLPENTVPYIRKAISEIAFSHFFSEYDK